MSEDGWEKIPSAEERFVLKPDDMKVLRARFASYPDAVLRKVHEDLIFGGVELDISPVWSAIRVTDEFLTEMNRAGISIEDERLRIYKEGHFGTDESVEAFFQLLKAAGYFKEDITNFVNESSFRETDEDRFDIRRLLAILDRVYGKE